MRKKSTKGKRIPKVSKKDIVAARKKAKLNPSLIRIWDRTGEGNTEHAGAGFRCNIIEKFVTRFSCAVGTCKNNGGKTCPFFRAKEEQDLVVKYHELTGKPAFKYYYEIKTDKKGRKKMILNTKTTPVLAMPPSVVPVVED